MPSKRPNELFMMVLHGPILPSEADPWKCSGKVFTPSLASLLQCSSAVFHPYLLSVGTKAVVAFGSFSKDMVLALFFRRPFSASR